MNNAARKRRGKLTALCFLLLALTAAVWAAAAAAPEEVSGEYVPVGNSFARISSGAVEVFSDTGEELYTASAGTALLALTPAGDRAAAWAPGGEALLLAEDGYSRMDISGRLLAVFGGECGYAAALSEEASGRCRAAVYGAQGEEFSVECEGFFPVAAALPPEGDALALLGVDSAGYLVKAYSAAGAALYEHRLDEAALTLIWDEDGLRAVPLQD